MSEKETQARSQLNVCEGGGEGRWCGWRSRLEGSGVGQDRLLRGRRGKRGLGPVRNLRSPLSPRSGFPIPLAELRARPPRRRGGNGNRDPECVASLGWVAPRSAAHCCDVVAPPPHALAPAAGLAVAASEHSKWERGQGVSALPTSPLLKTPLHPQRLYHLLQKETQSSNSASKRSTSRGDSPWISSASLPAGSYRIIGSRGVSWQHRASRATL